MSHTSSNGDNVKKRLENKGNGNLVGWCAESLIFYYDDPNEIMLQLLVNDSGKCQDHFKNIFKPEFNYMSSFTGKHKEHEFVTCINYAELFETDKNKFRKFE